MIAVKHFFLFALSVAMMLAVLPYPVVAEEGASSAEAKAHEGRGQTPLNLIDFSNKEVSPLVAPLINFTILFIIVYVIMKKPLSTRFRERKSSLVKALEEAGAAKAAAEAAILEARAKMDAVDREMADIRATIIAVGEKEAERIAASAEAQTKRIAADTEMLIAQEVSRLAEAVRKEIVEKIIAEASKMIVEKITDADRDKISRKYLVEIGQETKSATDRR